MSGAAATAVEQATVKLPPGPCVGVGMGGRDNVAGVSDKSGGFGGMIVWMLDDRREVVLNQSGF